MSRPGGTSAPKGAKSAESAKSAKNAKGSSAKPAKDTKSVHAKDTKTSNDTRTSNAKDAHARDTKSSPAKASPTNGTAGSRGGVVGLLASSDPEVRVAAAVVLGELGGDLQGPVARALAALLDPDAHDTLAQRAALRAVAKLGADGVPDELRAAVLNLLGARDEGVREAAVEAAVAIGKDVVVPLRKRLENVPLGAAGALKGMPAPGAAEKRAIETVLSRLGGKEALGALLAGIIDDPASARTVTHELRAQIKDADGNARRALRAQLEAFLAAHPKPDAKTDPARAAALKVLGHLEDERIVPLLVKHAKNPKEPDEVRQEAVIALRFAAHSADASVLGALLDAAKAQSSTLAQTALLTLGALPMSAKVAAAFRELASHPDVARAHLAIRRLASDESADGAAALAAIVADAGRDEQRAQLAADALAERRVAGHDDGAEALVTHLAATDDARTAARIRHLLRPVAPSWPSSQKKKLLASARKALDAGRVGWREAYDLAAHADAKATAKDLREAVAAARKSRKRDRERELLGLLLRIDPTPEDRYRLALFLLAESKLDPKLHARRGDEALRLFDRLAREDFDLSGALRKEKNVSPEQLYYLGFCFVEEGNDLGEELLRLVVEQAGRKKIGKAAKNKLELAAR